MCFGFVLLLSICSYLVLCCSLGLLISFAQVVIDSFMLQVWRAFLQYNVSSVLFLF